MPHLDVCEVWHSACSDVAFTLLRCGVCPAQVWHSGHSGTAYYAPHACVVSFQKALAFGRGGALTGMWQVNGRSLVTDFEKIVELDVEYIDNWSLMEDIRILCKTVTVLLKHADAY